MEKPPSFQQIYLETAKSITDARLREGERKDAIFIKIAGGSLVVSVSFLAISEMKAFFATDFLVISWSALLGAIIAHLLAYLIVECHFIEEKRKNDKWITNKPNYANIPKEGNVWTVVTHVFNYISYALTIVGLVFMVIFGINNINNMSNNTINGKESVGDGYQQKAEPAIGGNSPQDYGNAQSVGTSSPSGDTSPSSE